MKAAIEQEQCQSRSDTVEREQARPKVRLYHASTSIIEKPDVLHSRDKLDFEKMDFSKYRAATTDELQEWLEYENHIASLHIYTDDLPF